MREAVTLRAIASAAAGRRDRPQPARRPGRAARRGGARTTGAQAPARVRVGSKARQPLKEGEHDTRTGGTVQECTRDGVAARRARAGSLGWSRAACEQRRQRRRRWWRGRHDRAAAAGVEDRALRVAGPAALREEGQGSCVRTARSSTATPTRTPAKQQQQAEAALTKGAKVLVLDPVDAASAARDRGAGASSQNVPVISYDRLITDAPTSTTTSRSTTKGRQAPGRRARRQAQGGRQGERADRDDQRRARPTTTPSCSSRARTACSTSSGVKIAKEYDTPDWSPDKAQQEMEQAITALGKNGFEGVYAANDGTAGGAIAAMKGAGIEPTTRPTTGQDAELAAIQRILVGDAVHDGLQGDQAARPSSAAEIAVALAKGEDVRPSLDHRQGRQRQQAGPDVGDPRPGRGDQGQRQGHRRQGRLLDAAADLHRAHTRRRARPQASSRATRTRPAAPDGAAGPAPTERTGHEPRTAPARPGGGEQELRGRAGARATSTSRSTPARSSRWSATTAPASRRWSRRSPASTRSTTARSSSRASR